MARVDGITFCASRVEIQAFPTYARVFHSAPDAQECRSPEHSRLQPPSPWEPPPLSAAPAPRAAAKVSPPAKIPPPTPALTVSVATSRAASLTFFPPSRDVDAVLHRADGKFDHGGYSPGASGARSNALRHDFASLRTVLYFGSYQFGFGHVIGAAPQIVLGGFPHDVSRAFDLVGRIRNRFYVTGLFTLRETSDRLFAKIADWGGNTGIQESFGLSVGADTALAAQSSSFELHPDGGA